MTKSLGSKTARMLKFRHEDTPRSAREFKRKYPEEFEALKAQTSGGDFTDEILARLRAAYEGPVWTVIEDEYRPEQTLEAMRYYLRYLRGVPQVPAGHADYVEGRLAALANQPRLCDGPSIVLKMCVDYSEGVSARQRRLFGALSQSAGTSGHPHAEPPYFCVGWVRYCDGGDVWLVEEVQTDINGMRRATNDPFMQQQLRMQGIDPTEILDLLDWLDPWHERFYEDALGVLFERAAAEGVRVEMVDYSYKQNEESPKSVYTDLPRKMGMKLSAGSEVAPEALDKTWKLTPNRRRR